MSAPISLSILTWKSPRTLEKTLRSLEPVKSRFDECLVVCQEGDPVEVALCEQYGFTPVCTAQNLGIQEGLAHAAEVARNDYVLVMENDCPFVNRPQALAALDESIAAIREGVAGYIKLGYQSFFPRKRFRQFWGDRFPPKPTWLAWVRPGEARACKAEAVYLEAYESSLLPEVTDYSPHLALTSSRHVCWTNRAFLVSKAFFLGVVIPFARAHPGRKRVNGLPDLEHPLNCPANRWWWRGSDFRVGLARPGAFGHERLDRPRDDEKKTL